MSSWIIVLFIAFSLLMGFIIAVHKNYQDVLEIYIKIAIALGK
jgi:hypothetical protein